LPSQERVKEMEQYEKILDEYTAKLNEIKTFQQANTEVFEKFDIMSNELVNLEKELRIVARDSNRDIENDFVKVTVSERYRKDFVLDKMLGVANDSEKKLIDQCLIKSVDKEKLTIFVEGQQIRPEVMQEGYIEELQTLVVTIKVKGDK